MLLWPFLLHNNVQRSGKEWNSRRQNYFYAKFHKFTRITWNFCHSLKDFGFSNLLYTKMNRTLITFYSLIIWLQTFSLGIRFLKQFLYTSCHTHRQDSGISSILIMRHNEWDNSINSWLILKNHAHRNSKPLNISVIILQPSRSVENTWTCHPKFIYRYRLNCISTGSVELCSYRGGVYTRCHLICARGDKAGRSKGGAAALLTCDSRWRAFDDDTCLVPTRHSFHN